MITDDLIKGPGSWLSKEHAAGIIVSSRARLARNVTGTAFPGWAKEEVRVKLCGELRDVFKGIPGIENPIFFDMGNLDVVDKEVLRERHLISNELYARGRGSGLIAAQDEAIAVMINEEDHLRLQAISPGMSLHEVWGRLNELDSEVEKRLDYAFSPRLGYLAACPSNTGTGLRASVMMHLSGLRLLNEVDAVVRGLNRIGFAVRGLFGEGTEAYGNMFQVSNQTTMGDTEENIIKRLVEIIEELAQHERNARDRLLEKKEITLLDQIGRAFGVLMQAMMLSSRESVDLLSILRLGVEMGIVTGVSVARINEIMLLTQPGHLQKIMGKILGPQERDEARAMIVRQKLADMRLDSKKDNAEVGSRLCGSRLFVVEEGAKGSASSVAQK